MKIYICASKHNYDKIGSVRAKLEVMGHVITLPESYDDPMKEERMKTISAEAHRKWKADKIKPQNAKVESNDAVLVLNYEKSGQLNYIGGATFLEIFKAFDVGKKIFLFNPIPDSNFKDELLAMNPTVINGDLTKIV
jgi:hypothetical protein